MEGSFWEEELGSFSEELNIKRKLKREYIISKGIN